MRIVCTVILLLVSLLAYGQQPSAVRQLEQQRKAALEEIETTNRLLKETAKTAQSSLNRLNLLSRQILSRKKVINLLSQETAAIDSQSAMMQREIAVLEGELEGKQDNYAKSVRNIYRRFNSQDKLLFILSADNFSQSLRRMRYLREYARWQKNQAAEIVEKQGQIKAKQDELSKTRAEKQALLLERETENNKLISEESNRKKEVQQLNKRQRELQAELKKKQQQAADLNRRIERLIAEEIARAEAEAKAARERAAALNKKTGEKGEPAKSSAPVHEERVADTKGGYAMTKAEKQLSDNFVNNKGKLPFPLEGRYTIVGAFGEQQHQELKYVRTNNSGIDIQTISGTDARVVFNGEVTRVFVVPGYNNSVIVRHGNYLTVYSNLSQVYVKAGDKVSTRQALGKIFSDTESGNATILHFQLWKERTKQNPALWLDM